MRSCLPRHGDLNTGSSPSPASPPLARARRSGTLTRIPTMRRPRPRCRCLSLIRFAYHHHLSPDPQPRHQRHSLPASSAEPFPTVEHADGAVLCCVQCNTIECLHSSTLFPSSFLLPSLSPPPPSALSSYSLFPTHTIQTCRDAPATHRWEQFQEISHAYSVLSDEDKRKKYDLYGEDSEIGANDAEDCERSPFDPKTRNPKPETLNDAEDRERNPFAESAPLPLPAWNWNRARCTLARAFGSVSVSMSLNGIHSYTRIRHFTCLWR